jgi:hypothetical protein
MRNSSIVAAHVQVDLILIERLLEFICREGAFRDAPLPAGQAEPPKGAVLVFLPGWDEIARLKDALETSASFGGDRCEIQSIKCSLHRVLEHCALSCIPRM